MTRPQEHIETSQNSEENECFDGVPGKVRTCGPRFRKPEHEHETKGLEFRNGLTVGSASTSQDVSVLNAPLGKQGVTGPDLQTFEPPMCPAGEHVPAPDYDACLKCGHHGLAIRIQRFEAGVIALAAASIAKRDRGLPSVDDLAHALWLEDGEVERHIEEHCDDHLNGVCDPAKTKAARQRAWERDALGRRTHWTRVASAVRERLRGAR